MYELIEVIKDGRVATLAFNRPEVLNAISQAVALEVTAAIKELDADSSVGVIVITGRGKHFCAGGDIKRMKKLVDSGEFLSAESIADCDEMAAAIRYCSKPVIAMVNGTATGAGCSVAMACDFRFVAPSSKLGMAFLNMGLPGDTGGIYLLMRLAGPTNAIRIMMTGEPVGGEEAVNLGLASVLTGDEDLEEATYAFAKKLSRKSATGLAAQKRIINKYFFGEEMQRYFLDEQKEMVWASNQPDFTEAVNSFIEKRRPEMNKQ